ncbi:MAG TPA: four-helix bundle copper-binding protein [Candidatus Thermoplasmatota archaeon]|nr:four-helix bundle copper-binding protein [Candidatus Thermoplasmatota archaeon]
MANAKTTTQSTGRSSASSRPSKASRHEEPGNPMVTCAQTCAQTLDHCLSQGGEHAEAEHIKGLIDCIEVCELAARMEARNSMWSEYVMELCAQVCRECETSCSAFEGDEAMQACAEACRACAEHCEDM